MLCLLLFSVNKRVVYFTAGTDEVIDKNWKGRLSFFYTSFLTNNASNGVFTVPHSGVYVFTFFLADQFGGNHFFARFKLYPRLCG